jgi:hypothetical protein
VLAFVAVTPTLPAQAQSRATSSSAVVIVLHPQVGDTLHTRLEQQTEVSSTSSNGGSAGPASSGRSVGARSVSTAVTIDSRTIVRASERSRTTVLTIVDSARVTTSDVHAAALIRQAEQSLRGQQLVLQLAPDGTVLNARDGRGGAVAREIADAMSAMPAVFPSQPVRLGETWMRSMPLPAAGPMGTRGSAHVRATFRLDSLTQGGETAYLSMRGDIVADSTARGVELSGTVSGAMQVDRARGWMADSRFVVLIRSLVTPPVASGIAPVRFITRVTQRLRTMDKR